VAEVSSNIASTAIRYRAANEALRARDQARQAKETAVAERANEVQRQKETAKAVAERTAQSVRDRRDNIEADQARDLKLKGQQQVLDSISGDTRYRLVRDSIALDLNQARSDEAAAKQLIDSEAEEALALDAYIYNPSRSLEDSALSFQSFLSDRDDRLTLRQQQERDFSVQQRIDQRISEDNVQNVPPGQNLARGSIVDISG